MPASPIAGEPECAVKGYNNKEVGVEEIRREETWRRVVVRRKKERPMLLPLAVALSLTAPTATAVRVDDPPVQIWIDPAGSLMHGDRVRVHVRTAQDAYVVVLRVDGDGRVRALFPLDPGEDDFVRGGRNVEVRGRSDREAFFVDEQNGTGVVLAAAAKTPFTFDAFVRGDHWDYRVLSSDQARNDPEAALLDIVQRMAGDQHFD